MSLKEWYHTLNKKYLEDESDLQYIVPELTKIWTLSVRSNPRIRPFYYCSKPSTKRWKR